MKLTAGAVIRFETLLKNKLNKLNKEKKELTKIFEQIDRMELTHTINDEANLKIGVYEMTRMRLMQTSNRFLPKELVFISSMMKN